MKPEIRTAIDMAKKAMFDGLVSQAAIFIKHHNELREAVEALERRVAELEGRKP